ncbi:integrase family protein [Candidatus Methanoperedens nitroreducens]|uniref:Integrase family protein n=1 Tax=Candidatus Methanoperedens nitratireducens TaxID=1392998 RepID=A0A062V7A8_9EURY|nr:integrase core domain-containing protein [Candidatus Methanoperedens nitroreducens]KCZ71280.1 integrase family protein [Candidatus Methanoperedens nitroreducens]MDJ1420293.1 integrase core domain-containing protein [Candidatus Methanoperedens sp.]
MQTKTENLFNPNRYLLSDEAKKRLRWMYILCHESNNSITQASNKIGISREWLSKLKNKFENNQKDPRSLEPQSRAPHHTANRKRISQEIENKIVEMRNKHPWGKEKISAAVSNRYNLKVSPPTVNRYLHKHKLINPKLSQKNKQAWENKKEKEKQLILKVRPPKDIKDYKPGALVEKDMKLVPRISHSKGKYRYSKEFYYQHSFIDSFTRIRVVELTKDSSSHKAVKAYQKVKTKFPFSIASLNSDNGGENEGEFREKLKKESVIHFYSRSGTPTDNPRVERSHLTDEVEFYQQGGIKNTFSEQTKALRKQDDTYNLLRPHQALGYLTPMKFYKLWKKNPKEVYQITEKWQKYLRKQRKRLANSRKMKNKEQIEKLMEFIDTKLGQETRQRSPKLSLSKCELCL